MSVRIGLIVRKDWNSIPERNPSEYKAKHLEVKGFALREDVHHKGTKDMKWEKVKVKSER